MTKQIIVTEALKDVVDLLQVCLSPQAWISHNEVIKNGHADRTAEKYIHGMKNTAMLLQ